MAIENRSIRSLPFLQVHQVMSDLYHQAVLLDTERRTLLKAKAAEDPESSKHDELEQSIANFDKQYADTMNAIAQIKFELHAILQAMNFNQLMKVLNQKYAVIYNNQTVFEKDTTLLEKINKYSNGAYATLFNLAANPSNATARPAGDRYQTTSLPRNN